MNFDFRPYYRNYYQMGGGVPPVIENEIEEVEIPVTYEDKVRKYYRDKINSQAYKDKLYNLGYADTSNFLGIPRLFGYNWNKVENLSNLRWDRVKNTEMGDRIPKKQYYDEDGNRRNLRFEDNRSYNRWDYDNRKNTIYMDDNFSDSDTLPHEYSYSEVNVGTLDNRMSDKEMKLIRNTLKSSVSRNYHKNPDNEQAKHDYSPYERKADIDTIRFNLYEQGLYNPKTDEYRIRGKWLRNPKNADLQKLLDKVKHPVLDRARKLHNGPYDSEGNPRNPYKPGMDTTILNLMKKISLNDFRPVNYDKTYYNV